MKVLLVNTFRDYARYLKPSLLRYAQYTASLEDLGDPWPPLEFAYLSSVLKRAGHQVTFVDAHREGRDFSAEELKGYDAVAANTAPYEKWRCTQIFYDHALDLLKRARSVGCRTAVWGPHVTTTPEYFGDVDMAVVGEPDPVIVQGLEGKIGGTVVAPEDDLDGFGDPDYSIFDFSRYEARVFFEGKAKGPLGVAMGSRGCPYPCTFCFKALVPDKVRQHSPDRFAQIVAGLKRRGCDAIVFEDLTYTINRKWALDVAERLMGMGVKYAIMTRVDRLDEELAEALGRSGCTKIELGVEAGNDDLLKLMHKKADWDDTYRAIKLARAHGIAIVGGFRMVYVPGETEATMREMVGRCRALGLDTFPNICTPYPKTPLWYQGVAEGKIRKGPVEWEDTVLAAGTIGNGFSREDVMRGCDRLAWESHRPYWRSALRHVRQYGLGPTLKKGMQVSVNGLARAMPVGRMSR